MPTHPWLPLPAPPTLTAAAGLWVSQTQEAGSVLGSVRVCVSGWGFYGVMVSN